MAAAAAAQARDRRGDRARSRRLDRRGGRMSYPFDPDTRDYVARLLYDAIPALYKLADQRAVHAVPPQHPELEDFIRALAGPLAVVRQSIEESYADLFIDSASDWVLPYLADMV